MQNEVEQLKSAGTVIVVALEFADVDHPLVSFGWSGACSGSSPPSARSRTPGDDTVPPHTEEESGPRTWRGK